MKNKNWIKQNFLDKQSGAIRVKKISDTFGENPAIITARSIICYREFIQKSCTIAAELKDQNVKAGERVAIAGANCAEYLMVLMALWQVGAVAVPASTRFPEEKIAFLLEKAGCQKLILLKKNSILKTSNSKLNAIYLKSSNLPPRTFYKDIPLDGDATLFFTSGSSGEPKAVLHSFGNHYYSALGSNLNIPFQTGDRWLLSLPLYHVGGLAILFRALPGGGAVAVPEENKPLTEAIQNLGVTHISLVATQLFRLLKEDKKGDILSKLKAILLGGSSIPTALIQAAVERKLPIYVSYGSTEMSSQISTTPPGAASEKLFTSGKVLKYRQLKIAPDGEILTRGQTLFRGYWEGNLLKRPVDDQGWFSTGDTGTFDEDGYLIMTGRKDNMFISGGENIQPEEIESVLCQIEGIEQAVVVPMADNEFGKRPVAFIKMRLDKPCNETEIRNFLKKHLARFKIPDRFFTWPKAAPASDIKIERKYFQQIVQQWISREDSREERYIK